MRHGHQHSKKGTFRKSMWSPSKCDWIISASLIVIHIVTAFIWVYRTEKCKCIYNVLGIYHYSWYSATLFFSINKIPKLLHVCANFRFNIHQLVLTCFINCRYLFSLFKYCVLFQKSWDVTHLEIKFVMNDVHVYNMLDSYIQCYSHI